MRCTNFLKVVALSSFIGLTQWSCVPGSSQAQMQSISQSEQVPTNNPEASPNNVNSNQENPLPSGETDPSGEPMATQCSGGKTPRQMGLAAYTKLVRQSISKVEAMDGKIPLRFPSATKCPLTIANNSASGRSKPVKKRNLQVVGYYSLDTKKVMPFYSETLSTLLKSQLQSINQQKLVELSQPPSGKAAVLTLVVLDTRTGKTYLMSNVALVGVYRDLINAISNDQLKSLDLSPQQTDPSGDGEAYLDNQI